MSKPNITPEQIRALRAGIEADRLAAEYIFGWQWLYRPAKPNEQIAIRTLAPGDVEPPPHLKPWTPADGECGIVEIVRPAAFSSDWNAMEQVVIQMRQRGWRWTLFCDEIEGDEKPWFLAIFGKPALFIGGEAKESGAPLCLPKWVKIRTLRASDNGYYVFFGLFSGVLSLSKPA